MGCVRMRSTWQLAINVNRPRRPLSLPPDGDVACDCACCGGCCCCCCCCCRRMGSIRAVAVDCFASYGHPCEQWPQSTHPLTFLGITSGSNPKTSALDHNIRLFSFVTNEDGEDCAGGGVVGGGCC